MRSLQSSTVTGCSVSKMISINGASALAYTMVEMAKANYLNVYQYLEYILTQRPDKTWTDQQLSEIAPCSEKFQSIKNHI